MAKIGVGVIGCGDIARVRYFPSIEALPELTLKAVYSRKPAVGQPITARYGGKLYGDLDSFLDDAEVEAVVVTTRHPSHAELSLRALAAGKHVLTEKPMATSLADARRLRQAAELSDRIYMALPTDDFPPVSEARRLIASGAIGRVSSADAVLAHGGPGHAPWFFDRDAAAWGVLADLGIYLISQLTYLLGPAKSVFGTVATVFPERVSEDGRPFRVTVDDSIAAVIGWADNVLATIRANWCSAADKRNVICETRIYGTEGVIFINMASPTNALVVYAPGRPIEGATAIVHNGMSNCYRPPLPLWDYHRDVVRAFADAIAGRIPAGARRAEVARQQHVIEIIAKLYESSEKGRIMGIEAGTSGLLS